MNLLSTRFLIVITLTTFITSCAPDVDLYEELARQEPLALQIEQVTSLDDLILPDYKLHNIPSDPKNPITEEKVILGKMLFHETDIALSPKRKEGAKTYSCASCHHAKAGFQSGMKQGIGDGGVGFGILGEARMMAASYDESELDVQPFRSPTILNTAYQDVMLWNGQFGATKSNSGTEAEWTNGTPIQNNELGFEGVETQAIAGLGEHRLNIVPAMIINSLYKGLFDDAFPDIPIKERYSQLNGALAIAAFERSVVASQAPFQKWLRGSVNALNENQKKGALLFFGKGKCYTCHSGPGLNGMSFHALGMNDLDGDDIHLRPTDKNNLGRGGFTKRPEDAYAFKTPTLYNLKGLKFLGHGASFNSINEIVMYKNSGLAENDNVPEENLDPLFKPLGLSENEVALLSYFIETGLYDDNLQRYVPEILPSGSCFPNADSQSKKDMDCM